MKRDFSRIMAKAVRNLIAAFEQMEARKIILILENTLVRFNKIKSDILRSQVSSYVY